MRVLVVDDSVVFRTAIKTSLLDSKDVSEVVVASNGKAALDFLKSEHFDGVTLDLEMPIMDGPETIKAIRDIDKNIPIIIFSGQNVNAANKTIHALEMGANDFVPKNSNIGDIESNLRSIQQELIPKFKALLLKSKKNKQELVTSSKGHFSKSYLEGTKPSLICIGSSTGGPDTLKRLFSLLKKGISTPILIVQHMPALFTTQLANSLNEVVDFNVKEAVDGERILPGNCYVAPGDFHMEVNRLGQQYLLKLNQGEKVCYVRPSVDVTLRSIAKYVKDVTAGIILTGMGADGLNGTKELKETNSIVIIQDEASSTVWGMPKVIYEAGHFDDIGNIEEIADIINQIT